MYKEKAVRSNQELKLIRISCIQPTAPCTAALCMCVRERCNKDLAHRLHRM